MNVRLFRIGKVWHYRFQIDGERRQRSTMETDRQRAQEIAERAYRQAQLWARGSKTIPTLRELVQQWIEVHQATASAAHVKVVETFVRLHTYDLGDLLIDELTTERVERARVEHLRTHAPASANQWLKVLRLLCNWAVRRGVLPSVPFNVRGLKVQKKPRTILPTTLAQAWIAAIDEREGDSRGIRTAVRLMLGLGLREAETITARWEWLDVERRLYTPGRTKGREADPIPVPGWLVEYLLPDRVPAGLIVCKPDGRPYPPGFTRRAMLSANAAVGAPHITAHRLRGTFATLLSEAGTPVQSIQRALRHKNLTTTAAYLEVNMDAVAEGQRQIAERIGFGLHPTSGGAPVANEPPQCHT
ncbi:tyrosine-type recombinase/integrase [Burkholderia sp. Bp8991]|uniref:tyrosine-type recombinase/integrase n=1 Tax=Burkholderia sp. Bp8991 TaxID=2184553 RepID=UPI000F5A372B|nr:tyrosine-type recombinase/integrase [Burkholderia sp. Bp8991]RQS00226.1 integrase [Burkholderia sp. Bp8991]